MKPCLEPGYGALSRGTRCPIHTRTHERTRRPAFSERYGPGWARRRQETIDAEPWCHNPRGCPHTDAGTSTNPLTADHLVPLARGGMGSPLVPMCRRCNSAKGARHV